MGKDVRNTYDECVEALPRVIQGFENEIDNIDLTDLFNFGRDWEEISETWAFMENIVNEIPVELTACTNISSQQFSYIFTQLGSPNISTFFSNLTSLNLANNIIAKGADITSAASAGDYYKMGQDIGSIVHLILNVGTEAQ